MSKARELAELADVTTVDSSGNVGIGTAAPTGSLDIARSGSHEIVFRTTTTGDPTINLQADGTNNGKISYVRATEGLTFSNGGAERMRLDASGNVGIGTAVPLSNLHIEDLGNTVSQRIFTSDNVINTKASLLFGTTPGARTKAGVEMINTSTGNAAGTLAFSTNNGTTLTERMRIDSSGATWIGGSTMPAGVAGIRLNIIGGSNDLMASYSTSADAKTHWLFNNPNGTVGTIRTSASTTTYNTSSDYRLKENITPIQGAADIVKTMRPCTYTFKAGGDWADGFIAHELQELHPVAVSGEKDAMRDEEYEVTPAVLDEEGNVVTEAVMGTRSVPDYQGVDYSKLTPILTAALQEALNKIDALETRLAALEAV